MGLREEIKGIGIGTGCLDWGKFGLIRKFASCNRGLKLFHWGGNLIGSKVNTFGNYCKIRVDKGLSSEKGALEGSV